MKASPLRSLPGRRVGARRILLAEHQLFHSTDLDDVREHVAGIFCPHRLETIGTSSLDAVQTAARVRQLTLSYLSYDAEVRIIPGPLKNFYLVQMPLAGSCSIRLGPQAIDSTAELPSVINPTDPLSMHWERDCPHLILRIERDAMESQLADLLGRPLGQPLRFDLGMDVQSTQVQSWLNLVSVLHSDLEDDAALLSSSLVAKQLEELIITTLLLAQPSNYSEALAKPTTLAAPRNVRRAVELIEAHPDLPLTVAEIAKVAGTSVRSLHDGFQRHVGATPMSYLRDVRLKRVHDDLLQARADASTVTEIAVRWGFLHLGRFASSYRRRFNEAPSQTLRR